jgi:hypothetical protein
MVYLFSIDFVSISDDEKLKIKWTFYFVVNKKKPSEHNK